MCKQIVTDGFICDSEMLILKVEVGIQLLLPKADSCIRVT